MGDLNNQNPKSPPLSLPPGFRFHPTEQQILSFYLTNKNTRNPNLILSASTTSPFLSLDFISEIDLHNYDPYDLPEVDSFPYGYAGSKKHWYYFTVNRKSSKRKSKGGFWKRKCRTVNVLGRKEGSLLGTKTSFVFYRRDSSSRRCHRTSWIMTEYALVDHQMDFYVLCRVFVKTWSANKVIDGAGLNAHNSEDIFATKGNVPYRQVERECVHGIGEVVVAAEDISAIKLQRQVTTGDGVGTSCEQQRVNNSNDLTLDEVELRSNTSIFLEGDFLELDDLVGPLHSLDTLTC